MKDNHHGGAGQSIYIITPGLALGTTHIGQRSIETDSITGHQIETIHLEDVLHLQDVPRWNGDRLAMFSFARHWIEVVLVDVWGEAISFNSGN